VKTERKSANQKRYNTKVVSRPATATIDPPPAGEISYAGSARRALAGFFITGMLFALLGAVLPAWRHHLTSDYVVIGHYFLSVAVGVVAGLKLAPTLLSKKGISITLVVACSIACAALMLLAGVCPPRSAWWRVLGLFWVGASAGLLNTALFHAVTPAYRLNPVATVNLAGMLLGLGCFTTTLFLASTFYTYTVPSILIFLGAIPGFFAAHYARTAFASRPLPPQPTLREALSDFKSLGALLFTLLLFFQTGNEGAVAGWLAMLLIQRQGLSPETSLILLALYWLALLVGHMAAQALLPRVSHGKLLFGSVLAALLGCVMLVSTDNTFGATTAVLLIGSGFAMITPLMIERVGSRFPYFHPGFFNGIFSVGLLGGMLAPATLGYCSALVGVWVVMVLPVLGSGMVVVLLALLWLEDRFASAGNTRIHV
jgi:MFS transporter, FHS family, glucose/mannose:H+ symporter